MTEKGTGFRGSQARAVLEGLIRTMAPKMVGRDSLYLAVCELAQDHRLWAELKQQWREANAPPETPPLRAHDSSPP